MENKQPNKEGTKQVDEPKTNEKRDLEKKLGTVGWAFFFIWIGIVFLANLSIGIGLLGIGIITLGVQVTRKAINLKFEGFWVVVGLLLAIGGFSELFESGMPLVPILLILVGLLLLVSIVWRKRHSKE